MRVLTLALLLVGLLSCCALSQDNDAFCESKAAWCEDPSYRPARFKEDEVFRVTALQAPLFFQLFHNLLGDVDLFHAGIAFQSQSTNEEVVFSYEALYEVPNATFPFVVNGTIKWCNAGAVCMTDKYDKNYWMKKNDLGFVTGAVANAFVDWIPQANLTFSRYNLWNIKSQFPAADLAYSFTCADFVWAAAAKLLELGGEIDVRSPPHRDSANLFATNLVPVDMSNATVYAQAVQFFEKFSFNTGNVLHDVEDFVEYAVSNKFVQLDGQYYSLVSEPPYVDITYKTSPICKFEEWASTRCEKVN